MNEKYLLSICIPTYNRATFLDESLNRIAKQNRSINENIELVVSDNCSNDNTSEIIKKYVNEGLAIRYIKNEKNYGPDYNIAQCFKTATGKYVWVLGDDDYLLPNAISKIVFIIKDSTYGLIHLQINSKKKGIFYSIESNPKKLLSEISNWITYISSNIVLATYVKEVNLDKYMDSFLVQTPLYLTAALSSSKNILVHERVFEDGANTKNNGGYNFFKIFIVNYLNIWSSFMNHGIKDKLFFEKEKYYLFKNSLYIYIYNFFFKNNRSTFQIEKSWRLLFKYYGIYPYFYYYLIRLCIKYILESAHIYRH